MQLDERVRPKDFEEMKKPGAINRQHADTASSEPRSKNSVLSLKAELASARTDFNR
jgi:hypothetical protein